MTRMVSALLILFFLGGCGENPLAVRALNILLDEPVEETPDQFPRFSPLIQSPQLYALKATLIRNSLQGGFLLESRQGTIESWLGNDGVGLILDRGLLHGTRGLGAGLLNSDVGQSAELVLGGRSGTVNRIHTYLNGNDRAVIHAYRCIVTSEGPANITLDRGSVPVRKMVETCNGLNESFQNLYWVDTRSDVIVRSRQWTGEKLGMMDISVVYNFR